MSVLLWLIMECDGILSLIFLMGVSLIYFKQSGASDQRKAGNAEASVPQTFINFKYFALTRPMLIFLRLTFPMRHYPLGASQTASQIHNTSYP